MGWLFSCHHNTKAFAVQLAECRRELLESERKATRLQDAFGNAMDWFAKASKRATRMEEERDHAQACLAQALAEKADLTRRALALEDELRTATKSADNLVDIADGLRNELRAVKARRGKR